MKKIFREYWIELLLAGLVIFGILLKISRVDINAILVSYFYQLFFDTRAIANWIGVLMGSFLDNISLYDLGSFVLLVVVMILLLYRLRRRYLKNMRWQGDACPRCKGNIHRIHRTPQDRLWASLMQRPFRRYQCPNPHCGWSGLLYGKPHEHEREPSDSRVLRSVPK